MMAKWLCPKCGETSVTIYVGEKPKCEKCGSEMEFVETVNDEINLTEILSEHKKMIITVSAIFIVLIVGTILVKYTCLFGHEWQTADCVTPKTCSKCGLTEGEALGHKWEEATCTTAKTCSVCGIIDGKPLGHKYGEWSIEKQANCTEKGVKSTACSICGEKVTEDIPATGHNMVDDKITTWPSLTSNGSKTTKCTKCGQTSSISFPITDAEISNITLVQTGILYNYPNKTVGTAFSSFFSNPQWCAHDNYVLFGGGCTWRGKDAQAAILFEITGTNFQITKIEIGDEEFYSLLEIGVITNTIFNG